jgi:ribosomal protein L40E
MVKATPDYQWVCQRCKADNAAHTRTCKGCGFSAFFTAAELKQIQGEMKPVGYTLTDGVTFAIVLASFFGWLALTAH